MNTLRNYIAALTIACLGIAAFSSLSAQTLVRLEISHQLNENSFALEQSFRSNINDSLEFDRLEYYLSEITLHHSSGADTTIPNLWVLVNASEPTNIFLGYHDFNQVDSITIHVGVDSAHNHLDPTLWEAWHPLAPKEFSMHWGWVSGYRFAAVEGYSTGAIDFEIHALDDKNYFATTFIPNVQSDSNSTLQLGVYANYAETMNNIDVSQGLLTHGADNEAIDLLENFRDHVFSKNKPKEMDAINGVGDLYSGSVSDADIKLNQIHGSSSFEVLIPEEFVNAEITVFDINGRQLHAEKLSNMSNTIELHSKGSGIYIVQVVMENGESQSKRLLIL